MLKERITERLAVKAMLWILGAVAALHTLILFDIIPFNMVWGGRLQDRNEIIGFELFSVVSNLFLFFIVCLRGRIIRLPVNPLIIKIAMWVMFGLFVLNTIGNLFSANILETLIFAPMTLALSLFSYRLARWW